MFIMNLKARVTHLWWWIATISNVILILGYFNFDLTQYIGKDWQGFLILLFGLLTQLGVNVDPSTKGLSDFVPNLTVQAINQANEVKTEASTTSINSTVSKNSQGDIKITSQGLESTSNFYVKEGTIISAVQANDLNARSKINVDVPQEG